MAESIVRELEGLRALARALVHGDDEPNVIIMRKLRTRANDGVVDGLLARPHKLARRRDYPKPITL